METVNQEINGTEQTVTQQQEAKTFTQTDVDGIVSERLNRERAKYKDYDDLKAKAAKFDELEEANKTELQKATEKATALEAELNSMKQAEAIRQVRDKVANETGVPASLLTASTEEECAEQARAILNFKAAGAPSYPRVSDGGEVGNVGKPTTRQQFAEWMAQALN